MKNAQFQLRASYQRLIIKINKLRMQKENVLIKDQKQLKKQIFSRQINAYGIEFYQIVSGMTVFIDGLKGVGLEVAKNLMMSNIKKLVIYDQSPVLDQKLTTFKINTLKILYESRGQQCYDYLKSLNPFTQLQIAKFNTVQYLRNQDFDCISVFDCYDLEHLFNVNNLVRQQAILNKKMSKFIIGGTLGMYGYMYNDFGDHHTYKMTNNHQKQIVIHYVERTIINNQLKFTSNQSNNHNLEDGDQIQFVRILGIKQKLKNILINKTYKVHVENYRSFSIQQQFNQSPQQNQIYQDSFVLLHAKKIPTTKSTTHIPLKQYLNPLKQYLNQQIQTSNKIYDIKLQLKQKNTKQDRNIQRILCQLSSAVLFQIWKFYSHQKKIPQSKAEIDQIIFRLMKEPTIINQITVQNKLIINLILDMKKFLFPTAQYLGGLISQQILKSSGYFEPVSGFYNFSFYQDIFLFQKNNTKAKKQDKRLVKNSNISLKLVNYKMNIEQKCEILEQTQNQKQLLQEISSQIKLNASNSKCLLVGVGALGNQLLRMLIRAIKVDSSISQSIQTYFFKQQTQRINSSQNLPIYIFKKLLDYRYPIWKIYIIDNQNIKLNNLGTHFFIDQKNIGKIKSKTICQKLKSTYPQIQFQYIDIQRSQNNLQQIQSQFWESLDFVILAINKSQKLRFQVGQICVQYSIPCFQCGVQNALGHCEVIIPHCTQARSQWHSYEQNISMAFGKSQIYSNQKIISNSLLFFSTISEFFQKFHSLLKNQKEYIFCFTQKIQKIKSGKIKYMFQFKEIVNELNIFKIIIDSLNKKQYISVLQTKLAVYFYQNNVGQSLLRRKIAWKQNKSLKIKNITRMFGKQPTCQRIDLNDQLHLNLFKSILKVVRNQLKGKQSLTLDMDFQIDFQSIQQWYTNKQYIYFKESQYEDINYAQYQNIKQQNKFFFQKINTLLQEIGNTVFSSQITDLLLEFDIDNRDHKKFIVDYTQLFIREYGFEQCNEFQIIQQTNKIVSALPPISSAIAGTCGIELIKYLMKKPIEYHKNLFLNLNSNIIVNSETFKVRPYQDVEYDPIMMSPMICYPGRFTIWDIFTLKGPVKLLQISSILLKNLENIHVTMISRKQNIFYNIYTQNHNRQMYNECYVEQLILQKIKSFPKNKKYIPLDLCIEFTDKDTAILFPLVKYYFDQKIVRIQKIQQLRNN